MKAKGRGKKPFKHKDTRDERDAFDKKASRHRKETDELTYDDIVYDDEANFIDFDDTDLKGQ